MRRNRLYCTVCGKRKSRMVYSPSMKEPYAICAVERGGCGALIPLYQDEYGKWHPERIVERSI